MISLDRNLTTDWADDGAEVGHADVSPQPVSRPQAQRVLFVTSEMDGYLKAGGLGEVSSSLPRAMRRMCDVRVLLPGFPGVRRRHGAIEVVAQRPAAGGLPPWSLGRVTAHDGLPIYVVLCDELYNRDGSPYAGTDGRDFADNDVRFARLSLAAAEIAAGEADPSWRPNVLHANDWPSALAIGYVRWKQLDCATILTIHNLAYQGLYDLGRLSPLGVPEGAFHVDGSEFHGQFSFLKTGIFHASHVTTVSENYAREITTAEHGCGLQGLLASRMREGRLTGILNGIDGRWLELADDIRAQGTVAQWKRRNADELRALFELRVCEGPIFSIISRLVHQKGIDLSIAVADAIVENGGQLVVTGRGDPALEHAVDALAKRHPGSVGARIGFDDADALAMFRGSDFLLMPSRFEPCGLSQMYAQSAASLPIAHKTGGLADTIDDGRSGFLFGSPHQDGLKHAVSRAMGTFRSKPRLARMRKNALSKRFDWERSARTYVGVYASSLAHR